MNLFQVDDAGCLFISPIIEDWSLLASKQIDTIFDFFIGSACPVPPQSSGFASDVQEPFSTRSSLPTCYPSSSCRAQWVSLAG